MPSAPGNAVFPSLAAWAASRPLRHRKIGALRAMACQEIPEWESPRVIGRKVDQVAGRLRVSPATVNRWRRIVRGAPESDWPYLLMPRWSGRTARSAIPKEAWAFFRRLYLSRGQRTVAWCWRRTCEAAAHRGWGDLPSVRTFQRRVTSEVSDRERVLKRHGPEALARSGYGK